MSDFLQNLKFDFTELLERITNFFSMLRNEVWDNEMVGLIMYLYSCIPNELRDFMMIVIVFVVVLGIRELLRKD